MQYSDWAEWLEEVRLVPLAGTSSFCEHLDLLMVHSVACWGPHLNWCHSLQALIQILSCLLEVTGVKDQSPDYN